MTVLERIATGEVTVAYRSWARPTVKAGGRLTTAVGVLAIDAVEEVDPSQITDGDARAAGAADADALRAGLRLGPGRTTYRIELRPDGPDPRVALRADDDLDDVARAELERRLDRMDQRAADGPWTRRYLQLIADHPAMVSTDLASLAGAERNDLKVRVRRLKALGLTESLDVGYRLSPRGERYLAG